MVSRLIEHLVRIGLTFAFFAGASSAQAQTVSSTETPAAQTLPAWLNKITLSGDVRLRLNQVDSSSGYNMNSLFRARLAATGKVNESLTANLRFASSGEDTATDNLITTSNQEMGQESKKKFNFIDIASLDFKAMDGLVISAGRATNPYFSSGKNELVWSSDLAFEGANVKWAHDADMFKPFVTLGYNVWSDKGNNNADLTMAGAQIGSGFKTEIVSGTLAASFYGHSGLKNSASSALTFGNGPKGNSTTSGTFKNNYELLNYEAEVTTDTLGLPLTLYGAYVTNSVAESYVDGFQYGLRAGKLKDPGTFVLDVFFRELKKDAIVGTFNDSTTMGGGTDVRGLRSTVQYQLAASNTLSLSGMWGETSMSGAGPAYRRFLLEYLGTF